MHTLQSILALNRPREAVAASEQPAGVQDSLKPTSQALTTDTTPSSSVSSSNNNHNNTHAVKVVCRLRPRLPDESTSDPSVVQVLSRTEIRTTDPFKHLVNRFDFSACYDEQSDQQDIYMGEVQDMVTKVFEGITATIFTFGCTGSGKTHTLQGSPSDPGITPRAVRTIFERVEGLKSTHPSTSFHVSITCYEIWKDKVWDLLIQGGTSTTRDVGRGDLPIREAANGQILIPHLRHVTIKSIAQFDKLYSQVMRFRSVSSTKLNHTSSRSHAILTIHVEHLSQDNTPILQGKCVLIDLAGSENNKKTGNENNKVRMKESVEINQSLLALRKVVRSLNSGDHRIPYRDSKLTRILSDSLGGTSAGLVICNIAPVASQYRDTINTLTFGSHSRNVENKVSHQALKVLDRKFLLPSVSLYQHGTKSVPSSLPDQAPTEPTPSAMKVLWARRPSVDAFSKLPFPHTPMKAGGATTTTGPPHTPAPKSSGDSPRPPQSLSLGVRRRQLSGCFAPSPSSTKPFSSPRILSLRPSAPNLSHHPTAKPSSTPAPASTIEPDDLDKRVEEAMRKNLDQLVQDRVDMLVQAKLNEASFTSRTNQRDFSPSSGSGVVYDSPPTTATSRSRTTTMQEEGERLVERICTLEQQFVSISNLLQSVTTTSRPNSETKIPRPSV